ncbi:hypothetical protein ACHAWX_001277, partial [Stephanocyclus meneghinianus]
FVEVSKRKYGIFDALRSYVSSFQSKTNKTRRMRGSGIVADDPHSTNNLHERDDSITSISSGAVGCSERALSDATIAQKSKIISAPIDQSEKARSQSAISVPLSRLAYNDQEGISDEIQDEKMRNAELLSKKRRIDHESERCEQPPFKKTRYISEDISYVDSQNDNENLSSPIGNRTYRCLYRPRIDKRYFERKHKKKVRVNVLSPVKRQQFCLQDQAINTSSCIHKTGGLFGSDCYDTLATSTFDNHSDFYAEISAKARHLRLKRRSQIPDKKRVELRSAPSRRTAGRAQTMKANTPLILEPENEKKSTKVTQTAGNKCAEAVRISPSNKKSILGFAPTQHTVGEDETKHEKTPLIL